MPRIFRYPCAVDAGGDHDRDLDHSPVLADLHHQSVRRNERVRTLVQGPGAERGDLLVEVLGHLRHLGVGQPGGPRGAHQRVHPAGGHPEHIAGLDHRGQRRFGMPSPFHQPLREQRAIAQLRDGDIQGAGSGVQVGVAVHIATVRLLRVSGAVQYSAPHSGWACAESSALTIVVSSSRIKSRLTWASSSWRNRARSILGRR
jgi:hypothetical protein